MIYISLVLYGVYIAEMLYARFAQAPTDVRMFSDVQQCIILMVAVLFFVIDILRRQRRYHEKQASSQ